MGPCSLTGVAVALSAEERLAGGPGAKLQPPLLTDVAVVLIAEERLVGGPGVKLEPPRGFVPKPLVLLPGLNPVDLKKDVIGGSLAGSRSMGALDLTGSMRYQRKGMYNKTGDSSYGDVDGSSFRNRRGVPLTGHDRRSWGFALFPGIKGDDGGRNDRLNLEV